MGKRKKAGETRRKGMGKRKEPGRMDGKSLNPQKELAEMLRAQFPQVFSEGKVNPDKLEKALGEELEEKSNATEIICLDLKITKKFVDKVLAEKAERFTCLDVAFKNNDQLKTNTAIQMEGAKIEFKAI